MRFNVPTALIAVFALCFAIIGTLVLPKAQADEHEKKTMQTFNPRVQIPALNALGTSRVHGQDGKTQLTAANSVAHRTPHTAVPLGSIATGGFLGLVAMFGLRRFSAVNSRRGERVGNVSRLD